MIFASAIAGDNTVLHGNGGNDALAGSASKDEIFGDAGDDLIGGGAGSDNISGRAGIPSFLPQMEYGNTLVSRLSTEIAKSSLATMGSSETRHLGRRNKMIEKLKINSRPCKFHESRWHISIKNRLRRWQYTLNGYFEGRFSESADSGNASTHSKAVSC